jgi:tRNA pseudouridine38-40 synthase
MTYASTSGAEGGRVELETRDFRTGIQMRIADALVNVGIGKLKPADVAVLLKTRKRITEVVTAPPQGLFLVKVLY